MNGRTLTVVGSLAAVVALAGLAGALAFAGAHGTSRHSTPSWVLLADNSLDSTAEQRREATRILGMIADEAAVKQGAVAATPFQGTALATVNWPVDHRFLLSQDAPNSYYRKVDLMRQAEAVKQAASRLFARQEKRQGTDIIGGLLAASYKLSSEPKGPRVLVLASNMWAVSPDDRLALKNRALSPAQIRALIDRLDNAGKVANLRDVCVFVVGAGIDAWDQEPTSIQLSMRRFWLSYFARARARVRAWVPTLDSLPSC